MIGKTISHYKIIEKLGEGGMGEVYLADDLKLERQAALKFLPQHLTKDKENVERFKREAKAAAALNHPNIITIYDVLETDSQICIVMECVDGESLRTKMDKGKLDDDEVIEITKQICEGLSEAHHADIVHRDIKPENILINTDGRVKILDFGLAKLKGVSKLTKETSTLGTINYMSPEQIQGREVDHRSDIWSLGIVFYEMLTSEPPFKGDYEQAIFYAILNEEPKRLENIQTELWEVVKKLLVKRPADRYSEITELLNDLKRLWKNYEIKQPVQISTKSSKKKAMIITMVVTFILIATISIIFFFPTSPKETSIKSIAVLPFDNIGNDNTTDYLGFSLANQIIGDLTYLKNITVRPSTSIEKYKDKSFDPMDAANELHVDFLITGRYSLAANKIRSDIELINVLTNELIWREPIEVNFENAFQFQDIVSDKVISGLRIQFSREERARMQKNIPQNPDAYEFYLRSLYYDNTERENTIALDLLQKSITIDSAYAPAFSELGYRTFRKTQYYLLGKTGFKKAVMYYLKAIELDDEHLPALSMLSARYAEVGEHDDAMRYMQRAFKINPNDAFTHFWLSYIYRFVGLLEQSEKLAKRSLELDPKNIRFRSIGHTYRYLGNYQGALKAYNLDKGPWVDVQIGDVYLKMGNNEMAEKFLEKVIEKEIDTFPEYLATGMLAYIRGETNKGLEVTLEWEEKDIYDSEMIYRIATIYGLLGDSKNCIRVLKKSIEGGFFCYPFFLIDPFLNSVRDDPEFPKVLALAKHKHEAFKQKYYSDIDF